MLKGNHDNNDNVKNAGRCFIGGKSHRGEKQTNNEQHRDHHEYFYLNSHGAHTATSTPLVKHKHTHTNLKPALFFLLFSSTPKKLIRHIQLEKDQTEVIYLDHITPAHSVLVLVFVSHEFEEVGH